MKKYIDIVLEENNELVLKEGYWTDEQKENLKKVYTRLYNNDEFRPLEWLFTRTEKSMGCYIYGDGRASLYKGPVNCMYLGIERHKYVPVIIEHFKTKLGFEYVDHRWLENFEKFGNYSGDHIVLRSKSGYLPNDCRMRIIFHNNDAISIQLSDLDNAKHIFEMYKESQGVHNIQDAYGKDIQDGDGNLSSRFDDGIVFYRINYIPNAHRHNLEELINIIELAYDVIINNSRITDDMVKNRME